MAPTEAGVDSKEEGPVLNLISKRLRALRKKLNRISQMEESISHGKPINKEQEEVLKSKPSILVAIDELEKLRAPISTALEEELSLASNLHVFSDQNQQSPELHQNDASIENLLNLLYFGFLFDVKSQGEFTATMLTRTHERGCCLTYDYVTDDATDLLGERDLDSISFLGSLLISRPTDSGLSHKNALHRCAEHAKLWLSNSDLPVGSNTDVTYASLREKLNKIMASDYFTATPEMKVPVEMAAAAAGNYVPFQVVVPGASLSVPVQTDSSAADHYHQEDSEVAEGQDNDSTDSDATPQEELSKGEEEMENHAEVAADHTFKEAESDEVEGGNSRRSYQGYRGGRGGGGRRGYSNGRGGRRGGYHNGRSHYYEHAGSYYPRGFYSNRGRGGRGGQML